MKDPRPWVCGGFRGGLLLLAVFPSSDEVRGGFRSVSLCFCPIYFCFDWYRFVSAVVSFTIVLLDLLLFGSEFFAGGGFNGAAGGFNAAGGGWCYLAAGYDSGVLVWSVQLPA
ncbi:hypothetical protein QL285_086069 [Trifolium repens]|nr:hypothetical protein QL285_086069 [Trifolium repens]